MSDSLTFVVPGPAVGINESNRWGKGRWYKTAEFTQYKERIRSIAKGYALATKFPCSDGPMKVSIAMHNCGHDVNAVGKVFLDALETVCYANDRQVKRLLQTTDVDSADPTPRVIVSVSTLVAREDQAQ